MKLVRRNGSAEASPQTRPLHAWKILLVDDEPDVRALTRLCLKDFAFAGRGLDILEAGSAAEARLLLAAHPDIAVALVDVVMETDDAGLRLVEHVRQETGNQLIRLIIRTGQAGLAPERYVIDHFDIDDYKDKAELTTTRLYTTVRSAIKAYRDLRAIELNRAGLARLLSVAPEIYRLATNSVGDFFQGVMTQVTGLCHLTDASFMATIDGMVATIDGPEVQVHAVTGGLSGSVRLAEIKDLCRRVVLDGVPAEELRAGAVVVPLTGHDGPVGYIYLEPTTPLDQADADLVRLLAQQCSSALENLRLHNDLKVAFEHAVDMLAEAAEFRDKTTGDHIARIGEYTMLVAMEMGVPEDEARAWGAASRLHDVGKVGVPDGLLRKDGPLSPEEFAAMRTHTEIGAVVLSHDKSFDLARAISLGHHERWDGKGYPLGVVSAQLPLATRIVSVVDVFDALVSLRPYKQPWAPDRAAQAVADGAGTQFDPAVVDAFQRLYRRGAFTDLIERSRREAQAGRGDAATP